MQRTIQPCDIEETVRQPHNYMQIMITCLKPVPIEQLYVITIIML